MIQPDPADKRRLSLSAMISYCEVDLDQLVLSTHVLSSWYIKVDVSNSVLFKTANDFPPNKVFAWIPESHVNRTANVSLHKLTSNMSSETELHFFELPIAPTSFTFGGGMHKVIWFTASHFAAKLFMFRPSRIEIGQGSTCGEAQIIAGNSFVSVGKDCMLSDRVVLQSNDQHAVIDLATNSVLNSQPSSIILEPHVWLGRQSTILKNVRLGAGSIVASGAIVTKSAGAATALAGNPAKVIKEGISWWRYPDKPSDVDTAMIALINNRSA